MCFLFYVTWELSCSNMRRSGYNELPLQDPWAGDRSVMGKLKETMYGTRLAPQIRADMVRCCGR